MSSVESEYHAYLLRLWHEAAEDSERPAAWRFTLEDTRTGARRGFSDFGSLVDFLAGQVSGATDSVWESHAVNRIAPQEQEDGANS